jgi:hypothetical protein
LPPTLPPDFVDVIQRCLTHDPARRPTATELQAELRGAPVVDVPRAIVREAPPQAAELQAELRGAPVVDVPRAIVRETPPQAAAPQKPARRRSPVPAIAAPVCLMLLLAIWAGLRMFHGHADAARPTSGAAQGPAQAPAGAPPVAAQNPRTLRPALPQGAAASVSAKSKESKPPSARPGASRPERPAPPLADASPSVVHEQMPVVARSALRTIHGHLKVAVLATVDPAGNVNETRLENPGPSSYFARSAKEAAGKWKFAAADGQDSRQWLLSFEFTSSGTTGHATPR